MSRFIHPPTILLLWMFLLPPSAEIPAQELNSSTVVATGRASLKLPAKRMVLAIDLFGRHQDVREAVKSLQDRIKAATTQVTALGALADSIQVGDPKISAAQSDAQEALRAQVFEGFSRAGRSTEESQSPAMITVTARLIAQWGLAGADAAERMAAAYELQQQIRKAKLSGADDSTGLSPEEQELLEEAQMLAMANTYSDEKPPGEPTFLFYAPVSPDDRAAMLQQAFGNAKAQATSMAQAAGVQLGELQSLQDGGVAGDLHSYGYGGIDYEADQLAAELLPTNPDAPRAVGTEAGTLNYSVQLLVGFRIAQ